MGIGTTGLQVIFHEGFGDTLAVLAFDTETVGRISLGAARICARRATRP
jgi:hypothetical protein